jgi:thiazole/oxazole-forming peptide maturase SagC family component
METSSRPKIRRHYTRVAHSPDMIELRYGVWNPVSLNFQDDKGRGLLSSIVALIDGNRTAAEIAKVAHCSLSDVYGVIEQLQAVDAIEFEPETALDAYLDQLLPAVQAKNTERSVQRLVILGDQWFTQSLTTLLRSSVPNVELVHLTAEATDLLETANVDSFRDDIKSTTIVRAFEEYKDALFVSGSQHVNPIKSHVLNRVLVKNRIPCLYSFVDGPFLLVGPTVVPGRTACFECFEKRVQMNLRENASYVAYKNALVAGSVEFGSPAFIEPLKMLLCSHAALEVINFWSTGYSFTRNKVLSIYLPTMEFVFNEVLRLPDCGACAPNTAIEHKELYFDLHALLDSRR